MYYRFNKFGTEYLQKTNQHFFVQRYQAMFTEASHVEAWIYKRSTCVRALREAVKTRLRRPQLTESEENFSDKFRRPSTLSQFVGTHSSHVYDDPVDDVWNGRHETILWKIHRRLVNVMRLFKGQEFERCI